MWFKSCGERFATPRTVSQRRAARLSIEALEDRTVPASFSEMVVFGDSLSDTGNVFIATGGVAGAAPYFEGRFSNGPVWVEVLAQELELAAPTASLLGGTNYAFAGAETGPGLSFYETPNVGMQVDFFLADRGGFAGDELIVVAAGSNDLLWQAPWGHGQIVGNLGEHITDLAAAGGTTFLVANSPVGGSGGSKFNELLAKELDKLDDKLGVTILPFDLASVWAAILQDPGDAGLTNLTDPACPGCGIGIPEPDAIDTLVPNPDEYFLWDSIHATRVVHAITGKAAAELVSSSDSTSAKAIASLPPLALPVLLSVPAVELGAANPFVWTAPATTSAVRPIDPSAITTVGAADPSPDEPADDSGPLAPNSAATDILFADAALLAPLVGNSIAALMST